MSPVRELRWKRKKDEEEKNKLALMPLCKVISAGRIAAISSVASAA